MNILKKYRLVLILIFTFITQDKIYSRHIIGGEITYECIGSDTIKNEVTFRIHCTIWRDAAGGGARFDQRFTFGVYYFNDIRQEWNFVDAPSAVDVPLCCTKQLDVNESNPCVIYPKNVSVEEGKYDFNITLPIISSNYMIAFQRCCRNNTISNIFDPGGTGAAYTVEITPESQMTCNNSPVFTNFPPIVICNEFPLIFDHSATDLEGDQLIYEFCAPLHAGGRRGTGNNNPCNPFVDCDCVIPEVSTCTPPFENVRFRVPLYTSNKPIGGSPTVRINSANGIITGTPNAKGQFVVGVCVKEYRNGILLSEIRRDFQFNVTDCDPLVVADITHDEIADERFTINSCGENTISFVNESYSKRFIKTYEWQFDLNGGADTIMGENVEFTFPDTGTYIVLMIINKNLSCSDTADIIVNIYPAIDAEYEFEYDTCNPTPVSFTDESVSGAGPIIKWNWDFGDGGRSNEENPDHLFKTPGSKNVLLKVRDKNDCQDIIEKDITWYPVPTLIVIDPSNFKGCKPASIKFLNLSEPIDSTYDVIWDFGDGSTTNEISPTHLYEEDGVFTIKIEITSPIGCTISTEYNSWITVVDAPEADFDFSPKTLTNFNKNVHFEDQSKRASGWQWIIDNSGTIFEQNPNYTFRDTGVHEIKLIAFHENGCTDTIVKFIDVVPSVTFHMPNAFTPNGDGKNDLFRGIGFTEGISNFKMSIWNRWGEEIFHTNNPDQGWNGLYNNNGISAPNGVYLYTVEYIGPRGQAQLLKGYATIIR